MAPLVGVAAVSNNPSVSKKKLKPARAASATTLVKPPPANPSMPDLAPFRLKVAPKLTVDGKPVTVQESNLYANSAQDIWARFSTMDDQQRNVVLRGLLDRCTTKQVDYICTNLNFKMSKDALRVL